MVKGRSRKVIRFFEPTGRYGFLCNYYPARININGRAYKSVEHYYQSQKTRNGALRAWIMSAPNGHFAFKAGRALGPKELIKNWDKIKVGVMRRALLAKFTQNKDLQARLLNTENAILQEDNPYGSYWAISGEDRLGKLLMEIRSKLKKRLIQR